ncbi:CMGC/DYRK/PRP4 protein kinase [Allomyces macrogynus ATCC 38327]|uniref:non-specific serine/threonine protein kinase n=1 Tax=Allomyces macrogynus (strain ATCC 38327) TaxID=578462 RepID=A0A0L0T5M1_ALLM3|nr:CMGC/DYRK/PRP4 protein kinase [Allomyces macrogynus ATCC 38327]|eukprot:KNE69976.1 CMGC/DYRK/PRP4 protein kinase [Allomyces macrogynus ATCC 38327]
MPTSLPAAPRDFASAAVPTTTMPALSTANTAKPGAESPEDGELSPEDGELTPGALAAAPVAVPVSARLTSPPPVRPSNRLTYDYDRDCDRDPNYDRRASTRYRSRSPDFHHSSSRRHRHRSRSRSRSRDRGYSSRHAPPPPERRTLRRYDDHDDDRYDRRRPRSPTPPPRKRHRTGSSPRPVAMPELTDVVMTEKQDEDEPLDVEIPDLGADEDEEQRLIEERRRRRMAILEKHQAAKATTATQEPPTAPAPAPPAAAMAAIPLCKDEPDVTLPDLAADSDDDASELASRATTHAHTSPTDSDDDDDDLFAPAPVVAAVPHARHKTAEELALLWTKEHADDPTAVPGGTGERAPVATAPAPVAVNGADEDDEDDMFAVGPAVPKPEPPTTAAGAPAPAPLGATVRATHDDNWDDADGYYRVLVGEVLDGRYTVTATLGKGVFSVVAKATDAETGQEVAIKLIRNNETMYKAGQKELALLTKLRDADPNDKRHVIRLLRSFEHRNHLCMVFESMSMNLREVLKKYGHNVGLNLRAVRLYAHQLFQALALLRKCQIIHADLKPDNILANAAKNQIKLCDLGSASDISENDITPYLVSRFYRAPEIILGAPYDYAVDMWSAACTLFELYTGTILFPGRSNNHMLRLHMELKGHVSHRLIKRGAFGGKYFDQQWAFLALELDRVSGKEVVRAVQFKGPVRDLRARVGAAADPVDAKLVAQFVDLLEKCLHLNPEKRMAPADALRHPFLTGKEPSSGAPAGK